MPADGVDERPVLDASALLAYLQGEPGSFEAVTVADAELAARRRVRRSGLPLADRLCLALADRLGVVAWTAGTAWGEGDGAHQIRG